MGACVNVERSFTLTVPAFYYILLLMPVHLGVLWVKILLVRVY
jgi:hypothetical protein